MSNLIPEKRVNKNGVLVTKHVKPAGASSAAKSNLPAPALSGDASKPLRAPDALDLLKRMRERDIELYGGDGSKIDSYGFEQPYIDKFPAQLRQDIYDFIGTADKPDHDELRHFFNEDYSEANLFSTFVHTIGEIRWIDTCSSNGFSAISSGDAFRKLYDNLRLGRYKDDVDERLYSVVKAEHLASKLHLSLAGFSLPHDYYRELEVLRSNYDYISPVLPVVMAYQKAREKAFAEKVQNPDLPESERVYKRLGAAEVLEMAEYAHKYPGHAEFIAATIKERGEFNPKVIDQMLGSGSGAVASGVL